MTLFLFGGQHPVNHFLTLGVGTNCFGCSDDAGSYRFFFYRKNNPLFPASDANSRGVQANDIISRFSDTF